MYTYGNTASETQLAGRSKLLVEKIQISTALSWMRSSISASHRTSLARLVSISNAECSMI